ncbi:hypothetical protein AB4517_09860 [Vibrio sp. 10N.222.52.C3]|uniref:hypothetical protein n=1 Tax=Vibrio sp. 10N.222.52.C3 TaxID=3229631 RepID=UPI00355432D1
MSEEKVAGEQTRFSKDRQPVRNGRKSRRRIAIEYIEHDAMLGILEGVVRKALDGDQDCQFFILNKIFSNPKAVFQGVSHEATKLKLENEKLKLEIDQVKQYGAELIELVEQIKAGELEQVAGSTVESTKVGCPEVPN